MAPMHEDIRAEAAKYYDVNPTIPDDRAFYQARLPSPDATVLELGCGTGRVLLPLAGACGFIQGIDRSPAMLARCLQKVQAAGLPPTKAWAELGDITRREVFACGDGFAVGFDHFLEDIRGCAIGLGEAAEDRLQVASGDVLGGINAEAVNAQTEQIL